jgi:hypothetical protein
MATPTVTINRGVSYHEYSGIEGASWAHDLDTKKYMVRFDTIGQYIVYVLDGIRYKFVPTLDKMWLLLDASEARDIRYYVTSTGSAGTIIFTEVPKSANPFLPSLHQDDGNWTPLITLATQGDLAITYTSNVGSYVRTGKIINFTMSFVIDTISNSTGSGNWHFSLPFESDGTWLTGNILTYLVNFPAGVQLIPYILNGQSYMRVYSLADDGGFNTLDYADTEILSADQVIITGTYRSI